LVDLPTLHSILAEYEITSTRVYTRFNVLYKTLTINTLIRVFERVFELQVRSKFEELSNKHSSCLSRELVTVVLDDSVFKQWLSAFTIGEQFDSCYACFFSGQFRGRNRHLSPLFTFVFYIEHNLMQNRLTIK
jgi:hypothetical protein